MSYQNGGQFQQWLLEDDGNGKTYIKNRATGRYLSGGEWYTNEVDTDRTNNGNHWILREDYLIPVFRYSAAQSDGVRFYYCTEPEYGRGWIRDGIAFWVLASSNSQTTPVYEYYHDQSQTYGGYRFMLNIDDNVDPENYGWVFNGFSFYAYNYNRSGAIPIYAYIYYQNDGIRYFYSTGTWAGNQGWTYIGVAFYVNRLGNV